MREENVVRDTGDAVVVSQDVLMDADSDNNERTEPEEASDTHTTGGGDDGRRW